MHVVKRNGRTEQMSLDKIQQRTRLLGDQFQLSINYTDLVIKMVHQLYSGITTSQIDELMAEQCIALSPVHPDYEKLASSIAVSNLHKNTDHKFSQAMRTLYLGTTKKAKHDSATVTATSTSTSATAVTTTISTTSTSTNTNDEPVTTANTATTQVATVATVVMNQQPQQVATVVQHQSQQQQDKVVLAKSTWTVIRTHAAELDAMIDHSRDYWLDYFGLKTLQKSYLLSYNGRIVERPQYMWLRVAVGIHGNDMARVKETYDLMSQKYFTHATPTLFNAGTIRPQLSSCFLIAMEEDSLDGIFNTLKDCSSIANHSGGIGLSVHNVRAEHSIVKGSNTQAMGLVPMLKVFNSTARYVHQANRAGSYAIYVEPWHADIFAFLELKKNHGDEDKRARDLFYALWIPDLFMERVQQTDGPNADKWSLFSPDDCPDLHTTYGDEFRALYLRYEAEGKARQTVSARQLWYKVLDAQMETGTPYMLYKDAVNRKCNQNNLGTIRSSNLCTEITEYSDHQETAVCNLASIGLPAFVRQISTTNNTLEATFDYAELHRVTKILVVNLNRIIDITHYPTDKTRRSNMRHRPIGIGVQGLADVFFKLGLAFTSAEAKEVNRLIFETMYHAAVEQSMELARDRYQAIQSSGSGKGIWNEHEQHQYSLDDTWSGAYSSFVGSPTSKGVLQYDMWGVAPTPNRYDWTALKADVQMYGLRNSLLVAPMPTASTSQIFGYNECFEPITSNLYSRRTMAGEFVVPNKHMMKELMQLGLWSVEMKNNIVAHNGSVQHLTQVDKAFKEKYRTAWEIPMRHIIDMAADRGAYICQSQSMNVWMADPTYAKLTAMHFYAWNKGLKTGMYYLRRQPRHQAQQFTIEPDAANGTNTTAKADKKQGIQCTDEVCTSCSA